MPHLQIAKLSKNDPYLPKPKGPKTRLPMWAGAAFQERDSGRLAIRLTHSPQEAALGHLASPTAISGSQARNHEYIPITK